MPLLQVMLVIIVVGVVLWLVNNFIPMEANVKKILNAVVIIGLIIWLIMLFIPLGTLNNIKVGSQRFM